MGRFPHEPLRRPARVCGLDVLAAERKPPARRAIDRREVVGKQRPRGGRQRQPHQQRARVFGGGGDARRKQAPAAAGAARYRRQRLPAFAPRERETRTAAKTTAAPTIAAARMRSTWYLKDGVHAVAFELPAPVQREQLDEKRQGVHFPAQTPDEIGCRPRGAAGREQIVDDQHPLPFLHRIVVDLERIGAVLEIVGLRASSGTAVCPACAPARTRRESDRRPPTRK